MTPERLAEIIGLVGERRATQDALEEVIKERDRLREKLAVVVEALKLCVDNFTRNSNSGSFLGDDDHEAWSKAEAALAQAREA